MGGLSSGCPFGSRFRSVEASYGLDLASVRRAGYLQAGAKASGGWKWWTDDDPEPTCTVGLEFDLRTPSDPRYRIHYRSTRVDTGEYEDIDIGAELYRSDPPYGGARYWFSCPRCWRRRRVLYLPPNDVRFACRICHRLRYRTQRERDPDRLLRKARKLWRRAGSTDGTEPYQKPKWMRWDTFSRLVLEGRKAQETGDRMVLAGLSRDLARLLGDRAA